MKRTVCDLCNCVINGEPTLKIRFKAKKYSRFVNLYTGEAIPAGIWENVDICEFCMKEIIAKSLEKRGAKNE